MADHLNSDEKLLNDVKEYGWHVIKVMSDDGGPGFGYSVGLFKTFGHPEIIVIGLNLDLIHSIINSIGEALRGGTEFKSGHFYSGLIEGYKCYFTIVSDKYYFDYVGYARWFYDGDDFPMLQCVYPTKKNIYPWEPEWPIEISNLQPILTGAGTIWPQTSKS